MIKSILVPASGSAADTATYAAALVIAGKFAAHIDALHVRLDAVEVAVASSVGDGSGGAALVGGFIEQLERDAAERERRAHDVFAAFCTAQGLAQADAPASATGGPSAQWHTETGQEARWLTAYGMAADLIVAPRGTADDEAAARTALETLLLETGRPLFIPGAAAVDLGTVIIGWKPTPQAVRAVAFAMPLLKEARDVLVVTVAETEGGDDGERLRRHLAWHGIDARPERLPPGDAGNAATLLEAAAGRAGLLVMGGYGHTRLREMVFGGFTQHVLSATPALSVLMAH